MVAWMNGACESRAATSAYICHAGCYDWTAMFADDAYGLVHSQRTGRLPTGRTWTRCTRKAHTPLLPAMHTPTLVIHGALDYRVPDAARPGVLQHAARRADVDARLLWFADENHWVLKPRNSPLSGTANSLPGSNATAPKAEHTRWAPHRAPHRAPDRATSTRPRRCPAALRALGHMGAGTPPAMLGFLARLILIA